VQRKEREREVKVRWSRCTGRGSGIFCWSLPGLHTASVQHGIWRLLSWQCENWTTG